MEKASKLFWNIQEWIFTTRLCPQLKLQVMILIDAFIYIDIHIFQQHRSQYDFCTSSTYLCSGVDHLMGKYEEIILESICKIVRYKTSNINHFYDKRIVSKMTHIA